MNIVEHGLYNIADTYFEKYRSNFLVDNKQEKRPYYFAIRDKDGIVWVIPLSSQTAAYKKKIDKDTENHGECLFYHIGAVAGVERVFLVGNMFPVTDNYLKKPYTIAGAHYIVKDKNLVKEIHKRFSKYLRLVMNGKLRPTVDILGIKKDLLHR